MRKKITVTLEYDSVPDYEATIEEIRRDLESEISCCSYHYEVVNVTMEAIAPRFKTIRQTAAMGILPEYRLRLMQKQKRLPGIQTGNRFMVNVDALIEILNTEGIFE